jgi:predicted small lipoprotein YifL
MMRSTALLALLTLMACGKKAPTEPAAAAPEPAMNVEMPSSADAKNFAKQFTAEAISHLNPTGSSDLAMEISFAGDGTWTSTGLAKLGPETLDCDENGTWKIEEMDGAAAIMEWAIIKTDCPNRENGQTQRVQFEFSGATYKVSFR